MYDMLLAEAMVEIVNKDYRTAYERQTVYDAVFAKHEITQAQYDSALIWYGQNMDLYYRINTLVLKDIDENIDALGDIKPNPLSGDISAKDSIDIWVYERSFAFEPQKLFNTLAFNIEPERPYSAGSSYVLGFTVWGVRPDLKHKPKISLNAVQSDTTVSVSREITGDGYYELIVRTVAAKEVKRLYGYVTLNNADIAYHRIYIDDIHLLKYNHGSKSLTAPDFRDAIPAEELDLALEPLR
jgi:hypothetical protein